MIARLPWHVESFLCSPLCSQCGVRRRHVDSRSAPQVVMQFGKVSPNVYILDYNPTITTALQAFSIALSTFDGKLRF